MHCWGWYRKESSQWYWALWPLHSSPVLCKSGTENTWGEARPGIDLQWITLLWCCLLHGVTFLSQSPSSGQVNTVWLRQGETAGRVHFSCVQMLDKYWSREGFLCNRLKHCLTISMVLLFFFQGTKNPGSWRHSVWKSISSTHARCLLFAICRDKSW